MKERTTQTTLTIVAGGVSNVSTKLATDLGAVLNDGNLRILPVLGYGGFHNVSDVLHLSGVDVGLVHADALAALVREEVFSDINIRLRYVTKLNRDPIFIVARAEIDSLDGLDGKTVNLGPGAAPLYDASGEIFGKTLSLGPGDGVQHTTHALVVEALGVDIKPTFLSLGGAVNGMRDGSVDAAVLIGTELTAVASLLNADDRLRIIPIASDNLPQSSTLPEIYEPVVISGGEYADILPPDSEMRTISVPLVMVTVNWPTTSMQYDKVSRFTVSLFENLASLMSDMRSPAWHEVDITAPVAGLDRFAPAEAWIDARATTHSVGSLPQLEEEFQAFLSSADIASPGDMTAADREDLFRHFLSWPQNPAGIEIPVRRTKVDGIGPIVGTLRVQNTVLGPNEAGVAFRPNIAGMEPARRYAFQLYDDADCGSSEQHAAAGRLWLAGAEEEGSSDGGRYDDPYRSYLPDLPDLVADSQGNATDEFAVAGLSLADLMQRAMVIHADRDESSPPWACASIN